MAFDTSGIRLKPCVDLFSTEASRQDAGLEKIREIPLDQLVPFKDHPFKVIDDESMMDTVQSIREHGILLPLIARPMPDGKYEIVSGHRRSHAGKLAGLETVPVIVRELDDDAAVILMVDSNLQRENILPSERAFALKMKLEAMKHQGQRLDLTCGQVGHKLIGTKAVSYTHLDVYKRQFKHYAAKISVLTSSVQYENDDVMKPVWGDDYSICCCVSATQTGKEMQFFGARANLAKCLLYALNGGIDVKTREQVGPAYRPITSEVLDYDEVIAAYDRMMDWLAGLYVNTLNLIQYMHDKYYYEAAEMALIDTDVRRTFATGIAGFSHVVDSLSAIKYAKVTPIRDETGLIIDFKTEGDFPRYGNDDDRADDIAVWLLGKFLEKIKKRHTYRDSEPTTSILTVSYTHLPMKSIAERVEPSA